jgi:hypothetical protein
MDIERYRVILINPSLQRLLTVGSLVRIRPGEPLKIARKIKHLLPASPER